MYWTEHNCPGGHFALLGDVGVSISVENMEHSLGDSVKHSVKSKRGYEDGECDEFIR